MQSRLNTFIRTALVLVVWFFCIYKIYVDFDHDYWFDDLIHTALIVLASIVSLAFGYIGYWRYKRQKNLSFFASTGVTVLCIIALIIITNHLKQQDKTPTIIYASKFYSGLNTISLEFRKNGTYKCGKSSFMGDTYYTRGRYTIKDSIIYLDKSNLFDLVTTNKLLMKTVLKDEKTRKKSIFSLLFSPSKPDTLPETYLYQLDNKGDTISSAIVLKINQDLLATRQ